MHLTLEERTTRVRKRLVVETTQNHLKINKKKTKKSTKQKVNTDPPRREREREREIEKLYLTPKERATIGKIEPPPRR